MIILTAYKVDAHSMESLNGGEVRVFQFWRPLDKEGYSLNWLQVHDMGITWEFSYYEKYSVIQPYRNARVNGVPYRNAHVNGVVTKYYVEWWKDSTLIEAPARVKLFR